MTVLQPELGPYNRLILQLQGYPALQLPVINTYAKLRRAQGQDVHRRSDSH